VFGVVITALDASSGQPVTSGLSGVLSDGSYHEDMEVLANQLVGAGERAGRYSVSVTASRYRAWVQHEIRVEANECHVQPVRLEAKLVRL
jgi:hypothetical protein